MKNSNESGLSVAYEEYVRWPGTKTKFSYRRRAGCGGEEFHW